MAEIGDKAAEWVAIMSLKPWAKNPRDNAKAVEKVMASIAAFGFAAPIVARRETGEIIAGHTRVAAAESLGWDRVPVRYMDGLSDADAAALALADNRLSEEADWNKDLLAEVLRDIEAAGNGLAGTGFDRDELDRLLVKKMPIAVLAVDVSDVRDQFWLSVRGPLPEQVDALETIKAALQRLPGAVVHVGTSERE